MSASNLLNVDQALGKLLSSLGNVDLVEMELKAANGRVLAEDILAPNDFPTFATSSMDGFALRHEDSQGASKESPIELAVVGDIPAGMQAAKAIELGSAMRIMTGAPLPDGASAVIPVEDTDISDYGPDFPLTEKVKIFRSLKEHQYMRPRGQDFRRGDVLLSAGQKLRPQDVALIAMNGISAIPVYARPQVALFSSGDELQLPGSPLGPGQIYDSNSFALSALIESCGAQVIELPIAPDDLAVIISILDQALERKPDLIMSSAGVSVGAHDYVREALIANGHLDLWRVNMRPGKPLAFGDYRGVPFIGLPGNPVSSFVSFEVFGRPALHALQGHANWERLKLRGTLAQAVHSGGRESYLRASFQHAKNKIVTSLTGHQGSGNLYSLVQADGLIKIPAGTQALQAGEEVEIWPFEF